MRKFLDSLYLEKVLLFRIAFFKKILLLFSIFFLFFFHAIQPTQESIDKRLKELKADYYNQTQTTNNAISLASLCYKDSKSIHYNDGIRHSGIILEIFYYNKGDFGRSIKISNEIETLVEKSDSDYLNNTKFYNVRATSYSYLGFLSESYYEYQKALKMAEKIPDNDEKYYIIATSHLGISNYYSQVLQSSSQEKIFFHLSKALQAGELISKNGNLAKDGTRIETIITLNYFLGTFYMTAEKPNMDLARKYFTRAQEIYETSTTKMTPENEVRLFSLLCKFYYADKNFDKAIEFGQKVLKVRKKGSFPDDIKNTYQFLSKSYLALGNKKESQKYMDLYFSLNDSINKNMKVGINQSAKRMISIKEKDASKKVTKFIYFTCWGIIIFVIIIFLFWKRNNNRLHSNYQKIIYRLEKDKNQISDEEKASEQKAEKQSYISNIASETQKQILSKLKVFEDSLDFLQKDMTLTILANYCNTNPKYLSEVIKTNKNKNFSTYINGLKIDYITKKIFKTPLYREYKISYLAEECGYSSSQVFVLAFKKETGVTPSYFINNLKKDN